MKKLTLIAIFLGFFSNINAQHDPFSSFLKDQTEIPGAKTELAQLPRREQLPVVVRPSRVVIKRHKIVLFYDKKHNLIPSRKRLTREERREDRFHRH